MPLVHVFSSAIADAPVMPVPATAPFCLQQRWLRAVGAAAGWRSKLPAQYFCENQMSNEHCRAYAWVTSMTLLKGKKDQFIIKTSTVTHFSVRTVKCGQYTSDSDFSVTVVNHDKLSWMRRKYPLPIHRQWVHGLLCKPTPYICHTETVLWKTCHRIILMMITISRSDLGPTWSKQVSYLTRG